MSRRQVLAKIKLANKVADSNRFKGGPLRALTAPLGGQGKSGRNNTGRIVIGRRGGHHKRRYRFMNFMRNEEETYVQRIEYDPNRTSNIALTMTLEGQFSYIVATDGMKIGDTIQSGADVELKPGNVVPISRIPEATPFHSIELRPGGGFKLCRAAGTFAIRENPAQKVNKIVPPNYVIVKLPSNEYRLLHKDCRAVIGQTSRPHHYLRKDTKAGQSRWKGRRPVVRGVAKNPVDHPNGGRTKGGKVWRSKSGVISHGYRTRTKHNNPTQRFIFASRHVFENTNEKEMPAGVAPVTKDKVKAKKQLKEKKAAKAKMKAKLASKANKKGK